MSLPRQPNQSIIDGIRCLQHVAAQERPAGVSALAADLGMEVTRVHRLLRTLAHTGMVRQLPNRKFAPGPALPVLAAQTLHAIQFGQQVVPVLERLKRATGEEVALGVLWERSVAYLYHSGAEAPKSAIGGHDVWPATRSGLGLAMLARLPAADVTARFRAREIPGFSGVTDLRRELARIRSAGRALVATVGRQRTLAVALPDHAFVAIGLTGRLPARRVPAQLALLRAAAAEIDISFGGGSSWRGHRAPSRTPVRRRRPSAE